jgi:hypothetical protein
VSGQQPQEIQIQVAGDSGSDLQEVADLTAGLREELLELDVDRVEQRRAEAPDRSKGDAIAWAELVVTLTGSLPALITAVRSWLGRQDRGSVTIELDGDKLTLEHASPAVQRELIDAWLQRRPSEA